MARYRVTTPDTARAPGVAYADFQAAQECTSLVCVRHLLERHGFVGCTVHRGRRGYWQLIFSSDGQHIHKVSPSYYADNWKRVEAAQ